MSSSNSLQWFKPQRCGPARRAPEVGVPHTYQPFATSFHVRELETTPETTADALQKMLRFLHSCQEYYGAIIIIKKKITA